MSVLEKRGVRGTVFCKIGYLITLGILLQRVIYETDHCLRIERPKIVGLHLSRGGEDGSGLVVRVENGNFSDFVDGYA